MHWLLRLLRIETATLLPSDNNLPVVLLTNRHYPAAALQGDVLFAWKSHLDAIAARADKLGDALLVQRVKLLQDSINATFASYNATCAKSGRGGVWDARTDV